MAGAWELDPVRNTSVVIAILHVDVTTVAWALGLRNLITPDRHFILTTAGMPFDHARNFAAMKVVESGAEWCFFLDSDVIPPRDALVKLIAHQQPIVSGVYCRRSPPHAIPVMMKNGLWVTDYKPGAILEVDVVGAGCLLIHRSVFDRMPPSRSGYHWFDWRVNLKGAKVFKDDECMSEDFTFCLNARKIGYKVLADTSIQCRHVGYAQAGHGTFVPMDTTAAT